LARQRASLNKSQRDSIEKFFVNFLFIRKLQLAFKVITSLWKRQIKEPIPARQMIPNDQMEFVYLGDIAFDVYLDATDFKDINFYAFEMIVYEEI